MDYVKYLGAECLDLRLAWANATSNLCAVQMVEAVDVLAGRGFEAAKIASLLFGASEINGCPHDQWLGHLEKNYGAAQGGGDLRDIYYDINTGQRYLWTDPVALAKAVPACYASGNVEQRCRPAYHPRFGDPKLVEEIQATIEPVCWNDQFGQVCEYPPAERACVLTPKWKKLCGTPQGLAVCWSFEKADLVTAPPPKAVKDRLKLASAKRIQTVRQSTPATAAKPAAAKRAPGNLCSEENVTF